ncbi:hypothetical protein EUX98_g4794 [Antrodiella citrinella]|uniref:BTB domain-containing protein n=1 Tax=Antrodiella citrinella TaxID=2447956 RepID=A0A4S4MTY9_9APHY|nr:hypothetical protein EUX98_g4794 [Antrodiella citrinella]
MQLSAVVRARSSSLFSQISIILAELGRRLDELSPETYEAISRVVDAQSWIPTADGRTCMSIHALLGDEKPPPGFHKVSSRLLLQDGESQRSNLPFGDHSASNASLLEELHSLGYLPLSHDELLKAIQLLKALDPSTLLESARSRLIVPNVDAELRPLHQIYFDNLGIRAVEVKLPKDRRKVNGAVKSNLATKLGVHTLSSLELERVTLDDGDVFEDLTTRISDVLKQYTEGQAFNEFLANAADAGAKQFDLALDKRQYPTSGLMSDEMVPFQTCPALIVYNNSTFSDEDWIGIKSVGVGGKRSRSEAIGKFGLGSLTMFHFSESWPTRENKDVWPGNGDREDSDPISRAVITGFYGDHFASSSRPFCDTMSGDRRIAPSEAEFVCSEPSGVKTIIFLLKPPTYVYPSARIRTRLPDDIRRVNAVSLRKLIISNAFVLRGLYRSKAFTADDVGDIFSRMIEESVDSVVGVNILPLMDGTLGTVEKGSVVTLFMREWLDDEEPWKIFPAGRFLLPAMHAFCDKLFDLNLDLNIRAFDEEQIVTLIRDVIPSAAVSTLSREQQGWLASLWRRFSSLGAVMGSRLSDSDSFKTLPLVPTLKPATFVSLQYCASSDDVLASPDRDHDYLERILDQVPGVHLIPVSTCPSWLQPHLASFGCSFEDVVRLFERKGVSSFTGHAIDKADHDKFAEYAREHVHSLRVPHNVMEGTGRNKRTVISYIDHLGVALQLPIWKARCNGQTMLVSASRYGSMLPLAVSLEVVNPFLEPSGTYMDYNLQLNTIFDIQPITVSALCSSLRFPSILEFSQVQLVKRLVSALITCGVDDGTTVYLDLPNTTRVPKKSNTLYAHFVPVFRSTFASSPELFLHPQLRDLENRLGAFGLNCAVTMQTFTECARFVHEELKGTGQEEHDGALDLYNFYSTELWRDEAVSESWNLLDDYRFVPRSRIRRNYPDGLDHPFFDHACPLPNIVSPGQILRPELEAIAWTQRALFEVAPSDQLLIAYPSLGVPRAEEVVEHLRTLRMIADRYKCNTNLIDDLLATYQWLNAHVAECRAHLREYAGEELFLNVDNPHITWRFAAGNQLIFNGRNEGKRQCVRSSMLPFKALILAAGAREIVDAVRPVLELSPAEEVLLSDRNTFNQYRLERKLTDVTLVSSDGQRFPAHRLILSTQSVWFESRFSPRWPANDTVGCSDVNGDILRYVLDFMYTRKNPFEDVSAEDLFDLQDTLLDLLKISHLWSISGLFELVENQLIGTISIDTCDELLKEAEMFPEATSLQEACAAYKANNLT